MKRSELAFLFMWVAAAPAVDIWVRNLAVILFGLIALAKWVKGD